MISIRTGTIALLTLGAALFAGGEIRVTSLAELSRALGEAASTPGTRIVLASGEYEDPGLVRVERLEGTEASPIEIVAEKPGEARFRVGGFLVTKCRYVTVRGLDFAGPFAALAQKSAVALVGCKGSSLIDCRIHPDDEAMHRANAKKSRYSFLFVGGGEEDRVESCLVENKKIMGPMVVIGPDEKRPRILGNVFREFAPGHGNGFEGLQLGNDYRYRMRATVKGNLFERLDGEDEVISVKTGENLIVGNVFRDCTGELCVRAANGTRIVSNLFVRTLAGKKGVGGVRNQGDDTLVLANDFVDVDFGVKSQYGDKAVDMPDADFFDAPEGALERAYRQSRRVTVASNRFFGVNDAFSFRGADVFKGLIRSQRVEIPKDLPMSDWRVEANRAFSCARLFAGEGEVNFTHVGNEFVPGSSPTEPGRSFAPGEWRSGNSPSPRRNEKGVWADEAGRPVLFVASAPSSR